MPIVSVDIVTAEPLAPTLVGDLANALAEVFGGPPSRTWVRLQAVEHYAEGDNGPPDGIRPVFASILMADPPHGTDRADLAGEITTVVAETCERPKENVHVLFEAPAAGRIAFGGGLVPPAGQ